MTIQYKWVISAMDTAPSEDGLTDVVKTVHWRYQAQDAEYFADVYGSMACATPSETDFTAYPDLTQDQVISWLEAGNDVDALQKNLDAQIENQKNPPIVNLPLPWAE
jgi:beta-glucanase (GH16 family)